MTNNTKPPADNASKAAEMLLAKYKTISNKQVYRIQWTIMLAMCASTCQVRLWLPDPTSADYVLAWFWSIALAVHIVRSPSK